MSTTSLDSVWQERFAGIDRLYGTGALARFAACRVAVVGMGGVGSWAVEALARTGIGHLSLIDADDLCVSNTNRQLPALAGQYGRAKVETMAERCRAINPQITVEAIPSFVTSSNLAEMLDRGFDLIIDACDSFRSKVEMAAWCRRRKLPLIVVGSAGGRTDPTLVRVRDLSRTEHDAMLALVRKKLRSEFNFPKNADRYFGISAIYSLENVKYPQPDGTVCGLRPQLGADAALKLDCGMGLGAATHITGTFAFAAVGRALELLLKRKP
ncbi:tRNA cyclic N6-threonylcarbamoyladenosine(37) synthase TcdA [Lysobacter cavernae]|uniref:tRNA cyclic N6-threonylcarbamoyladenosine(37) synthase TcdA n=1 Tax=Lysobacter cavernae TaxID=1685901 RepID=A0ABV7RSL2_9GAMM